MTDEPIVLDFDFADLPMLSLLRKVQSFHRPNRAVQVVVSVAGWLVLTLGFVGLVQVGKGYPAEGPEFAIIGFAAGMVATVLVLTLVTRMVVKSQMTALLSARSRTGRIKMVLGTGGIEYQSPGLSLHQSWDNIQDVVVLQDVTMIMPSHAEFYPAPHRNLPSDVSPEELAKRIAAWRTNAQVVA